MRPNFKWLIVLFLPLFAACSSASGLIKKTEKLIAPSEKKVEVKQKEAEPPSAQQEGAFHIVGTNETLRHICDVYGLDLKKVAQINKLTSPYNVKVGETIFLPADALLASGDDQPLVRSVALKPKELKISVTGSDISSVAGAIRGKRHPLVPDLIFPVPGGVLTSPFGYRWGVFHKGLDIAAPVGTPVFACSDGRVVFTGTRKKFQNYGRIVLLQHAPGVYTQYAHLNRILVNRGQKVRAGQQIANVGNTGRSTGPHLHLEVRVRHQMYNPLAYFSPSELKGTRIASRFSRSPMGPVPAGWKIPELLTSRH